jgi:hypothetical protein
MKRVTKCGCYKKMSDTVVQLNLNNSMAAILGDWPLIIQQIKHIIWENLI